MLTLVCQVVSSGLHAMLVHRLQKSVAVTMRGVRPRRRTTTLGAPTNGATVVLLQ